MNSHLFLIITLITSTFAWARSGEPGEGVNVSLSLSPGAYRYSVYEQESLRHTPFHNRVGNPTSNLEEKSESGFLACASVSDRRSADSDVANPPSDDSATRCIKELTTYLEITETPTHGGRKTVERGDLRVVLGDLVLEIIAADLLLPVGIGGTNRVVPKSAIEALVGNVAANQGDLNLRKYGSTIFDNNAAKAKGAIKDLFPPGHFLSLTDDLQRIVNEAWEKGSRVIVIIRTAPGHNIDTSLNLIR